MKIDILSNFDFDKLEKKWSSKIKVDIFEHVAKDTEKVWKNTIKTKNFTPLKQSTKEIRKLRGRSRTLGKPLIDTGRLLDSIKAKKRSISHIAYGEFHMERHKTTKSSMIPNKTVPARKWKDKRFGHLTKKTKKRVFKEIKLGLRRAGKGKIIARF